MGIGGERGIRTLETVARLHAFQACAFSHSATSPALFTFGVAPGWLKTSARAISKSHMACAICVGAFNHSATSPAIFWQAVSTQI